MKILWKLFIVVNIVKKKTKEALKETFVTVFSGLVLNWPLSLGFLYLCFDILELSTFAASIWVTAGFTLVAIARVFTIRMYYIKDE